MSVLTLLRYLIGDREAILQIASNRHALWVGFLFVISAGFAREYDGEDLLHEPWYLVLPLGASLASSFLLFTVSYGVAIAKGESWSRFLPRYLSFLGLFWLTAPQAWLYAIPYERFLSPLEATRMNLITLAVVSLWRVALMVRVLRVLFNFWYAASLCLVMLFADAVALVLLTFLPFPLIDVMGGLHLSAGQRLTQEVAVSVCLLGGCSLPLWLLGGGICLYLSPARWVSERAMPQRLQTGLIVLAFTSVLIWAAILPFTQPEQQHRREVERAYEAGDLDQALALLSSHSEDDYPPHWQPPGPRAGTFRRTFRPGREWAAVIDRVSADDVAPWVQRRYIDRVRGLPQRLFYSHDRDALPALGRALSRTAEGRALIEELKADPKRQEIVDLLEGRAPKDRSGH
jgi:hypothetical protein